MDCALAPFFSHPMPEVARDPRPFSPYGNRFDTMTFKRITIASAILLLVGCTTVPQAPLSAGLAVLDAPAPAVQAPAAAPSTPNEKNATPDAEAGREPRLLRGDDKVIAAPPQPPAIQGTAHAFKFEEAPISEVVHVMLRDILKVSYVLHQPVAGTVTLATKGPVSADDALAMLESALLANGLVMVRDTRGTYHVGKPEVLRHIGTPVRMPSGKGPLAPGYGAIVVPLQYIGAAEMATILKPLMPADALVRVDNVRNLLVLVGTRVQAEGWMDMVATFDVNLLKGMSVGVFPLKNVTVAEVESALEMLGSAGAGAASSAAGSATRAAPAAASMPTAPASAGGLASVLNADGFPLRGAIRVMPMARINSVLVVTPRAAYLDEARRWIEKLDQPSDNGAEPGLHIYKVQNGSAQHLATVLSGIFGAAAAPAANQQGGTGVAPGLRSTTAASSPWQQPVQGSAAAWGNNGLAGGGGAFAPGTGGFGGSALGAQSRFGAPSVTTQNSVAAPVVAQVGGVRVMADTLNNSILVWSTTGEFQKIESTLKRLDLPPTQVLIEATIIEVTLSDDLKYGLQWAFLDSSRRGLSGTGVVGQVPGAATGGFSYTLTDSLSRVRATLNALADKSLIKVISSPSLMVLDNQVATMAVGTQQPIRTGETTNLNTIGNQTTTTYQYKDTGVQLQVQPSVNAGDLVTMDINQSVTDVGDEDAVTGQRAFLQRQISSKVAVRSGQAIVLGGLIKDNATTGKSGVPILHDIPVIGALFGATTTSSARTELLVVITPKVVRTDPEIREISEELRDRLKGLHLLDMRDGASGSRDHAAPAQRSENNQ